MRINPTILIASSLTITIVILLAQNLGTVIQISFLGLTSLPLPLSLAMLFAFLSGGIAAALWNQLAVWLTEGLEQPEAEIKPPPPKTKPVEDDEDDYEDDDILEIEYIDE